jgi:hypothetical protein
MKSKRRVQAGKLETAVKQDKSTGESLSEQRLIIHCLGSDDAHYTESCVFRSRNSRWIYVGQYVPEARRIIYRASSIKINGRNYALNICEHVPTELEPFLIEHSRDENMRGRAKSEIVLRYGEVDGHYKEDVIDITSKGSDSD